METWKPVIGYEGFYEASNLGRVRSVPRRVHSYGGRYRDVPQCVLRPTLSTRGYPQVRLSKRGVVRVVAVHRVVAPAFYGPLPLYQTTNHIDGNKHNNAIANLEYVTQAENNQHAIRTGLRINPSGSRNGMSKLTEQQVCEIKQRLSRGESQTLIARDFPVTNKLIHMIAKGKVRRSQPARS